MLKGGWTALRTAKRHQHSRNGYHNLISYFHNRQLIKMDKTLLRRTSAHLDVVTRRVIHGNVPYRLDKFEPYDEIFRS